jgi:hypothetical protein
MARKVWANMPRKKIFMSKSKSRMSSLTSSFILRSRNMNTFKSNSMLLAAAGILAVAGVGAAASASFGSTVTWGTAANISGNTDVSTVGSLVLANEIGGAAAQTVNGVTFSPFTGTNAATITQGNVTLSAPTSGDTVNIDSGFGPSTFSSSYNAMLNGAAALGNGSSEANGLDPMDLTIAGLTPGSPYLIEIWVNDSRGYPVNRQETLSGSNSDSAVIDYLTPPGQFITGTFVADSTGSQTISMTPVDINNSPSNADAQINAFQVRAVPEPATLGLVGVGAMGLLLIGRKRKMV